MSRWEPDASGRLRQAAMELFVERGYEQTTVAEIAQRAGLTARTFFRHFADKREVLFASSAVLLDRLAEAVEDAPASASTMTAVLAALDAAAAVLGGQHETARQRYSIISANAELRERELIKLASLSAAIADGLRRRGVADPEASLAAEAGIAVLRVAFEHWLSGPADQDLARIVRQSFDQLKTLTATI
ncbi:TetR/AcrR family transcriptional regulator [Saccharothrix coeruleofusca]|uniref:TetR family transcriptional regulator n=1 Tax=Saccharothrix coeruleofusca TaxID=33919 RepID=A0A918APK2_9PSEU|nr:TetR/AcrR family transcriptional regulator [Saccharothrix coeruleofusca]MBP2337171.1 AcrR family transcriptional regulator [Saccharothrix coeruleofusca]GGP66656.1 TetR family transcriptional regulator [Saccharothrix coeruleofusca]